VNSTSLWKQAISTSSSGPRVYGQRLEELESDDDMELELERDGLELEVINRVLGDRLDSDGLLTDEPDESLESELDDIARVLDEELEPDELEVMT